MKVPSIGVVKYNKGSLNRSYNNDNNTPAFKGRVDTEMRRILVERPIVANVGHSGYTTYYYDETVGEKTDEINRMVNIYRPYSWERTNITAPLGTPAFSTFTKLGRESMFNDDTRYSSAPDSHFQQPFGFTCDKPELKLNKEIPDYLEEKDFRLLPPVRYQEGRPVYKTGEPVFYNKGSLYSGCQFSKDDVKEVRTEIWQGAIGEIGKPLNRLESLEDKLKKLEKINKDFSEKRTKVEKEYQKQIDIADKKAGDAFSSKTSMVYYNFRDFFIAKQRGETTPLSDMNKKLEKNIAELKKEIEKISTAKKNGKYIDLSTRELYENCDIVKTAKEMNKQERYRDVIVSLPDRTYTMQGISYYASNGKDWYSDDEQMIRDYLDKIMYPERAKNIAEGLLNSEQYSNREYSRPFDEKKAYPAMNTLISE